LTATSPLSESFIGLIILPIAGNAAEHITAVTVASKGKVDLAIGVSFGSSIQIALFVNPLMVLIGWLLKKDMTLYFGLFETVTLVGAALLVNFLIWNGRTNYLEGTLLCACYVMIGYVTKSRYQVVRAQVLTKSRVGAFLLP
jgi:Ca2+:H+ antiporter